MKIRTLDEIEVRVLGALLEKEQTTPDYYPLTVNALLAAVNQKTNRDPVTALGEEQVLEALDRLRRDVLVWRSEGARAERWRQSVSRRLELQPEQKALLTLLMLRGAQTPGELRSRSGRLHGFATVARVEEVLEEMASGDEPLVAQLERRPGQKESRWAHLLAGPLTAAEAPLAAPAPAAAEGTAPRAPGQRESDLARRVAGLEAAVDRLTRELEELTRRLGG